MEGGKFSRAKVRKREDPRIREQEWGNYLTHADQQAAMRDREKVGKFFFRFRNGESGADVYDRVCVFLDNLFKVNKARGFL